MGSAESPHGVSMTEPLPPSLLFFVSNFHNLIPIKLNEQNYTIWKLQCEGALKSSSLFDYVQESRSPFPTITDSSGTSIPNPTYFTWFVAESHLRSCLISTLSPAILAQVTHTYTALELCEFLKLKFAKSNSAGKNPGGELPSKNGRHSPVICQICATSGHVDFPCCHRLVESLRPDQAPHNTTMASNFASDSNAHQVFDISPHRELLAIGDGSTVSADNTSVANGTTMLPEPDMLVLNQSGSSFVEDGLVLSLEEMMGYQTREGSGNPERLPFQQKSERQISEAKKKVISMQAKPEKNLSGSKRKSPLPPYANDLYSEDLKKNKMTCFCSTCQGSRLRSCKQNTGKNNDIGGSPEESENAIEHTRTTNDQKIQNSQNAKLEGKSLPIDNKLNGGNTLVLMGTTDDQKLQNSEETKVEGNSSQVNKNLNGGKAIESRGITIDQKIKNFAKRKLEVQSSQVNKKLNDGNTTEVTGIDKSHKELESLKRELVGKLREVNTQLNGCNSTEVTGITISQEKQISLKRQLEVELREVNKQLRLVGKSLKVIKMLNVGKATVLKGITADQKIQNPQEKKLEENSLQVNKKLNGGNAVEFTGTSDFQKIKNSHARKEGNSLHDTNKIMIGKATELTGTNADQKLKNPQEKQLEENILQVNKKLNGCSAVELTGATDDQKIQNPQGRESEKNSMQVNKKLNCGDAVELTGTAEYQKNQNLQERKLEGNSIQANTSSNGGKATVLSVTTDNQMIQNPQERKLEEN